MGAYRVLSSKVGAVWGRHVRVGEGKEFVGVR